MSIIAAVRRWLEDRRVYAAAESEFREYRDRIESDKKKASTIANKALRELRRQGLDCVSGGYDDVSQKIHTAILHAARDALGND
jgi:hypothetical protein